MAPVVSADQRQWQLFESCLSDVVERTETVARTIAMRIMTIVVWIIADFVVSKMRIELMPFLEQERECIRGNPVEGMVEASHATNAQSAFFEHVNEC